MKTVLFLCTANSARSILAEALLNHLGKGRFIAYSAGSQGGAGVNPLALSTLAKMQIDPGTPRSKSWDEFAVPGAPPIDIVLTVCDNAAGEVCPVWPGHPACAHWGIPDPAAAPPAQREHAFFEAALLLRRRIELLLALPDAAIDRLQLEQIHAQ